MSARIPRDEAVERCAHACVDAMERWFARANVEQNQEQVREFTACVLAALLDCAPDPKTDERVARVRAVSRALRSETKGNA